MGAIVFWLGIALGIALLLMAAWILDRRSRRRGHRLRGGADISRDVREQDRDLRSAREQRYLGEDQSWTYGSRQVKDRHAR